MSTRLSLVTLAAVAALLAPHTAAAELIFFSSGRSMSVLGHRLDGDTIVVRLRDGGEMTFSRHLVSRIAEDEVPQPEVGGLVAADQPAGKLATGYDAIIERVSAEHGVDADLVKAVIEVESAYQPRARSRRGAMGLMQLMPSTAKRYALENPYDPAANIEAGTRHLGGLLRRFDLPLALAAYNAGEAAVLRYRGIPPYAETRAYVTRVLALLRATL
jgi:soluble lytic murein transglycosylase-like protein